MKSIGYDRPLFVQPFDHRGSFTKTFFDLKGAVRIEPDVDQHVPVSAAKTLIYRGLLRAMEMGVPRDEVGVLVDAQFGSHILADAKSRGIPSAVCVEKSGQNLFDFEYGSRWQDHLRFFATEIVKCLVRYHPQDEASDNREQLARLKSLSDYIHANNDHYLMFELLVPALTEEDKKAGDRYDAEIRPRHMVEAIRQIQEFGVEPDIWKIEGLDARAQAEAVSKQVRSTKAREKAGCILLGRGSNAEKVHEWLRVAAPVEGFIGFAVGRTNFSDPLKRYLKKEQDDKSAVEEIAENFKSCVDTWKKARG
jgi:5-dehydro-2-deoxygluconokinase